ncbi:EP300-interacting inhibitor of differentiation 3-like [Watersipora subatra]|uniref:EP300-interacting inhibitor of differentiation 3-like n=1 Tax=Watersipora subatra TaxID=2589382 RepID=UPI00355C73FF
MAGSHELKAAYRELNDEVNDNEEEMVKPDSDSLVVALKRGSELFGQVKTAVEGAEDSRFMVNIAYLGRKKVQELKTESTQFRPVEFVEKVAAYTLQGKEGGMRAEHWAALGHAAQPFFKKPPSSNFLLGAFSNEPEQKKERVKRMKTKDDRSNEKSTTVKKIVNDDESLETTAHDVSKRVLPQLRKLYNHNGKVPIDYYEFVTDPNSFGITVENMFHVSFLIRDGLAEISLDEDGLPAIKPTIYGLDGTFEGRERELQSLPRRQVVNNITMDQWRTICKTFKIKKARIPPRKRDG